MAEHPLVDPSHYRTVLGHFASGVTIITAMNDGEPVGMAANSFSSVSLDPPLGLFCARASMVGWAASDQSSVELQRTLCRRADVILCGAAVSYRR